MKKTMEDIIKNMRHMSIEEQDAFDSAMKEVMKNAKPIKIKTK